MKLTVLADNNCLIDHYFYAEPALSFFIEDNNTRVLFDVGYSDVFMKNAEKLKINLRNLDYLVFSHGHLDHTWGLDPLIKLYSEAILEKLDLSKPTVVAHPLAFESVTQYKISGQPLYFTIFFHQIAPRFYRLFQNRVLL